MIELQAVCAVLAAMLAIAALQSGRGEGIVGALVLGLLFPALGVAHRKLREPRGQRLASGEPFPRSLLRMPLDVRGPESVVFTVSYAGLLLLWVNRLPL